MTRKNTGKNKNSGGEERKTIEIQEKYTPRMTVIFDSYISKIPNGKLQVYYYENLIPFTGLDQLLLIIEDIMDAAKYPQAGVEARRLYQFRGEFKKYQFIELPEVKVPENFTELCEKYSEIGQWFVEFRVYCRQHASIQGVLLFGKEEIYFRSGMEFVRFLHEFLSLSHMKYC